MISQKVLKSLSKKRYREKHNLFIIEGPDVLDYCLARNYDVLELYYGESFDNKNSKILTLAKKNNISCYEIADELLKEISDTVTTQGILAVAQISSIELPKEGPMVFLDALQDPGNMGTIIRTAVSAGFTAILAGSGTVDFYNPKVVRSSAGAFAGISCVNATIEILRELKGNGYEILVTDCHNGVNCKDVTIGSKSIIIMGSEGHGVSDDVKKLADHNIYIPLKGNMESLNVAIAFAVIAFS